MQITIDTRHDTLEEELAVIQLAFAQTKDLGVATGTPNPTRQARRRKADGSTGRHGSSRAAGERNDTAVDAPATSDGATNQAATQTGISAGAVEDRALRRPRVSARKAPTKKTSARRGATKKAPTQKAPTKTAAAKTAPASRAATKRAPTSRSAASRTPVGSNTAPDVQADVRAWARDQGMQVKACTCPRTASSGGRLLAGCRQR
jgi:hypothetical protein